ncbi:MAG: 4-hydroxy-tetrahydrodipicolinate synthase [Arenimonas sp.]|uniref:4-hydroxy-tetrahydrodipicolinate synthase n=1 Tax=Arenimonas sp. TaxID=1872635 RepID=UPI003C07D9DE
MQLQGSITALTTPFTESGMLDLGAWRAQIDMQVRSGSAAIVVAGSTGEAATLSDEEYSQLIELAAIRVAGRIPVLAGTGLSSTAKTIRQTKLAKDSGADIALVVTPPYVRPTQAGLFAHYSAVADAAGIPVVLYNVPGRTGCDLQPQTVARLCSHGNIIGLKEAVGDEARWQELYPLASPAFSLLSGDDPTFVRAIAGGAQGVISVASNVVPAVFARICQLLLERNVAGAQVLDASLRNLYDFLGVEPNPVPVKALMRLMGFGHGLRLPLLPLSEAHAGEAQKMLELCKTIEQSI